METNVANYMLPAMQIVCHLVVSGTPGRNVTTLAVDQTTPTPLQPTPLPEGYVAYPDVGFAYKVYDENVSWMEARSRCVQNGAQLALIDSAKKAQYVKQQKQSDNYPWVGIINMYDDREWIAVSTGLPVTSLPWRSGEPTGDYDCVGVDCDLNGLRNNRCNLPFNYVCEIPILEKNPMTAN